MLKRFGIDNLGAYMKSVSTDTIKTSAKGQSNPRNYWGRGDFIPFLAGIYDRPMGYIAPFGNGKPVICTINLFTGKPLTGEPLLLAFDGINHWDAVETPKQHVDRIFRELSQNIDALKKNKKQPDTAPVWRGLIRLHKALTHGPGQSKENVRKHVSTSEMSKKPGSLQKLKVPGFSLLTDKELGDVRAALAYFNIKIFDAEFSSEVDNRIKPARQMCLDQANNLLTSVKTKGVIPLLKAFQAFDQALNDYAQVSKALGQDTDEQILQTLSVSILTTCIGKTPLEDRKQIHAELTSGAFASLANGLQQIMKTSGNEFDKKLADLVPFVSRVTAFLNNLPDAIRTSLNQKPEQNVLGMTLKQTSGKNPPKEMMEAIRKALGIAPKRTGQLAPNRSKPQSKGSLQDISARIHPSPGDGDCFYHSIAHLLKQNFNRIQNRLKEMGINNREQIDQQFVRNMLAAFVRELRLKGPNRTTGIHVDSQSVQETLARFGIGANIDGKNRDDALISGSLRTFRRQIGRILHSAKGKGRAYWGKSEFIPLLSALFGLPMGYYSTLSFDNQGNPVPVTCMVNILTGEQLQGPPVYVLQRWGNHFDALENLK